MKLNQLVSECDEGPCPTVWAIEGTGSVLVQGFKVDDEEALTTMQLPNNETAVRVPMSLILRVAREHLA
ncbi:MULTISPECIES: hypothetical protein [unclassified Streptomyces]|uniref:hypothetical protein n=1 Tax=unclassified Streptomyces TaxID=2593676 RepID=UPI000DAC3365|nr:MULTISPECIES: hypothetical protein [unclassified Streptomyces]PZT72116.1 hypothetical protein DNK55_26410 [Streptomyces sp. AC1-42T]PZT81561.1 hypothetical protein DNK56_05165 [Streptomyces sp. AC1-42W]